jgi:hypothetical protein
MLWLTQLAGRPIAIIPWFVSRTTTLHEDFLWLIQEVAPYGLSSILKVWPLLDDRLMAILKLDIVIYNIGIKVSKCILVNLLESLTRGNNSFRSKSTLWMVSNTLLATAPFFVYTWFSNQLIHCVNSSVTWWPKTFNHGCSMSLPIQRCTPSWYKNQFHSMANLSHFVA